MRTSNESSAGSGLFTASTESKAWVSDPCFEQIFLRHYQGLVQVLWRMVGERAQAEELADDVFWKLHQQPALWTQEEIGGWLYRTATHAGIDAIRARSRRGKHEQAAARAALQTGPTPLDEALREERAHHVRLALAHMKPAQAQLLVLRNSGFSYKELAEVLDVKPSSIGTLLSRAEAEFEKAYQRVAATGREGK